MKWIRVTSIYFRSPDGVKSVLAAHRLVDTNKDGHPAWRFISVKHWDEYLRGTWTIRISDTNAKDRTGRSSVTIDGLNELPVGDHPSTTTKAHPKHTEHLPGNHGRAEGEADEPSFVLNAAEDTAEPSSSSSIAPSGTMAGSRICPRRSQTREDYSALSDNDLMLSALTRGGRGLRRKELYDVFGEQSDDEDEWEGLRTGSPGATGVGDEFHEGFLDE
ncbi:hypothetical protein EDB83DRAFT_2322822 [Lactarius deliciosus]|nr:hypothetical protein EDB83DRAFT_2322822 [Lactarius deliciosus]